MALYDLVGFVYVLFNRDAEIDGVCSALVRLISFDSLVVHDDGQRLFVAG